MNILSAVWNKWKVIAHKIGVFQSRLILTVVYFTILLPVGIIFRIRQGKNVQNKTTWIESSGKLSELKNQY